MNSTKKTLVITLALLILTTLASVNFVTSISIPRPLIGTVENGANTGVDLHNQRTGEVLSTQSSDAGEYLFDLANLRAGYKSGDVFDIYLQGCESTCRTTVQYTGAEETFAPPITGDVREPVCPAVREGIDWMQAGAGLVLGLLASLVAFMGGGIKVYKSRLGGVKILHRHKGIKAYHDPDVQHKNPRYRHVAWSDDPLKCAKQVKQIEEEGGLE